MDYHHLFSEDVPSFMRSPVREIFRKVDLSAICSFAGGYPAAVTFPVEDLRRLPGLVLDKYGTKALQYGATQGVPELREAIAAFFCGGNAPECPPRLPTYKSSGQALGPGLRRAV